MERESDNNLRQILSSSNLKHKIMIWGCTDRGLRICSELISWGFTVIGYIDRKYVSMSEYNGYRVYGCDELKNDTYFVYIALDSNNNEIIKQLGEYGYEEFTNYWYPRRLIRLDGTKDYSDMYGNSLKSQNINPVNILLRDGGKMKIMSHKLEASSKLTSEGNSEVIVGENVVFGSRVEVSSINGKISILDNCKFENDIKLRVSSGGTIVIGENCTIQRASILVASFNARLVLERDCMLSYYVLMRAGNSHNIIDLKTKKNLDDNDNRNINIGEHVWIGMRATIMNGVEIGAGSTVGANSFVCKRKFPNNCCLAGNPAVILRDNTAWIRDGVYMHTDIEDYMMYVYDDENV